MPFAFSEEKCRITSRVLLFENGTVIGLPWSGFSGNTDVRYAPGPAYKYTSATVYKYTRHLARLEINHCKNPRPKMNVFLHKVAVCMIKKKIRGLFCFVSIGTRSFTHEIRRRYLLARAGLSILLTLALLECFIFSFSSFVLYIYVCVCVCVCV